MNKILRIILILAFSLFAIFSFNFGFGDDIFLRFLFLLLSAALGLFLFIIEALKKKEGIVLPPIFYLLFAFLIFSFFAAYFSADFYNSLFGFLGESPKSLLGFAAFIIISFLVVQVFNKEFVWIFKPFFIAAYLILALIFILLTHFKIQLSFLSLSYLPMQLGIFFIIGYFLIINLLQNKNAFSKSFSVFLTILIFYLLLSFDSQWLWVLFAFGALLNFLAHHLYLPKEDRFPVDIKLVAFALALFFTISQINFTFIPKTPPEFFLLYNTSFDISLNAVKERPFFGWGLNNFELAFAKYKPQYINASNFYNVDFQSPKTFYEEMFVGLGIGGGILFILVLILNAYYIIVNFKKDLEIFVPLAIFYFLIIISGFIAPFSSLILYLLFISITLTALLVKENFNASFSLNKEIVAILSGVFILVVILSLVSRFLIASYYFTLAALSQNENQKITFAQQAIAFNPYQPLYIQQYSAYLFNLAQQKTFSSKPDFEKIALLAQTALLNAQRLSNQYNLRPNFKYYLATLYVQGQIYANKPEEFLNEAEKLIKQAISLSPRNVIYKTYLGDIYFNKALLKKDEAAFNEKKSLLEQAKKVYEEARAMTPIYAPVYFGLAQIYEQEQDLELAKQNFLIAVQLSPQNIDFRFNLARILYNIALNKYNPSSTDEWQVSKKYLEDILENVPNYSNALYLMALIYEKEGDIVKAKQNLQKLTEILPNGSQKEEILKKLNSL